jgi:hypothetical protein
MGMGAVAVALGRELTGAAASWGRALGKLGEGRTKGAAGRAEGNWTGTGGAAGGGVVAAPAPNASGAEPGARLRGPASRPKPDAIPGRLAGYGTLAGGARRRRAWREEGV